MTNCPIHPSVENADQLRKCMRGEAIDLLTRVVDGAKVGATMKTEKPETLTLKLLTCLRCGHQWYPLPGKPATPVVCAKCHNPYWNIPKGENGHEAQE